MIQKKFYVWQYSFGDIDKIFLEVDKNIQELWKENIESKGLRINVNVGGVDQIKYPPYMELTRYTDDGVKEQLIMLKEYPNGFNEDDIVEFMKDCLGVVHANVN